MHGLSTEIDPVIETAPYAAEITVSNLFFI